jgi:hypothetical protein
MKIKCTCGKTLTEDLRPMKKIGKRFVKNAYRNYFELFIPKGTFGIQKKSIYSWSEKDSGLSGLDVIQINKRLVVPAESILNGIVPPFKEGAGCCNYSAGCNLKCTCSKLIGEMHLDCYEENVVKFIPKNIVRSYK